MSLTSLIQTSTFIFLKMLVYCWLAYNTSYPLGKISVKVHNALFPTIIIYTYLKLTCKGVV